MKVWKIPPEAKERLEEMRRKEKQRKNSWMEGWDLIEKLTGLKPKLRPPFAVFAFTPEKAAAMAEVPQGLRWKSFQGYGSFLVPDQRTKKGKEMQAAWDKADIQPLFSGFELIDALFGGIDGSTKSRWRVRVDTIAGVDYLIEAKGFEPENYGYQPVEV